MHRRPSAGRRALAAVALALLGLPACDPGRLFGRRASEPSPGAGGSVTLALTGTRPLDPARAGGEGALVLLATACDGLTALDPATGEPRPALAASWSVEEGARRLVLHLREGARFHDGSPVDALSVAESLSRVARPETSSPWASLLAPVEGFEDVRAGNSPLLRGLGIADGATLSVSLAEPAADFPAVLAHPGLVPLSPLALQRDPDPSPARPACSGPYRFETAQAEADVRLVRARGRDGPAEVLARGFEGQEEAYEALERGEADAALVPEGRIGPPEGASLARRPVAEVAYLAFGLSASPTADPRLRTAVSLAVDRLALIDAAFGDRRRPATGWLGPAEPGCSGRARSVADRQAAAGALASIGVDPAALRFPLTVEDTATGRRVGESVAAQLADVLGVAVEPVPLEGPTFGESVARTERAGAWLLTASGDIPQPGRLLGSLFATGAPGNRTGFSDPRVDDRLRRAGGAASEEERARLLEAAQEAVCEKMPAVPLWNGVRTWAFRRMTFPEGRGVDAFGGLALREAGLR